MLSCSSFSALRFFLHAYAMENDQSYAFSIDMVEDSMHLPRNLRIHEGVACGMRSYCVQYSTALRFVFVVELRDILTLLPLRTLRSSALKCL
jgi:hypothetical protein